MVDDLNQSYREAPLALQGESLSRSVGRTGVRVCEHFSLDLWMTLIRSHPEYKKKRAALFANYFAVGNIALAEQAIRKVDLMANHINEVVGGNIDAPELYMMALYEAGADVKNITNQQLNEFLPATEKLFFDNLPLPLDNSVEDGLKLLQDTGASINILSNTGFIKGAVLRQFFETIGWDKYFSFSIFSDETGFSKPSANMFEAVWETAKKHRPTEITTKKQVLHIGDNRRADYDGALSFGIQAFQFLPANGLFYPQLKTCLKTMEIKSL